MKGIGKRPPTKEIVSARPWVSTAVLESTRSFHCHHIQRRGRFFNIPDVPDRTDVPFCWSFPCLWYQKTLSGILYRTWGDKWRCIILLPVISSSVHHTFAFYLTYTPVSILVVRLHHSIWKYIWRTLSLGADWQKLVWNLESTLSLLKVKSWIASPIYLICTLLSLPLLPLMDARLSKSPGII